MRRAFLSPLSLLVLLAACAEEAAAPAPARPAPPEVAAETIPAQRGRLVAERICGFCHQVTPERMSAVEAAAPSFMEIANLPGRSREYLREFSTQEHVVETLGDPPVVMPTVDLTPEQREEVIAWLLTFQRDPATALQKPTPLRAFE